MKKILKTENKNFRVLSVGNDSIDVENRTVVFSAASEYPVRRYDWEREEYYNEILSMTPEDIDFTRVAGSPVLAQHDQDKQIGVIERASVEDGKFVVVARFSDSSARANEYFADIASGIRRNVSIGYQLLKVVREDVIDGDRTVVFRWMPYEVSIVSVPADPTVGVGREQEKSSLASFSLPELEIKKTKKMIIC